MPASASDAPRTQVESSREITASAAPGQRGPAGKDAQGRPQLPAPPFAAEAVLSSDVSLDYARRIEALQRSDAVLSAEEWTRLAEFVASGDLPQLSRPQLFAFKNDTLNLLAREPGNEEKLRALLTGIYRDAQQHATMRDYALQHLASLPAGFYDYALHWQALEQGDPALAATALLHLASKRRKPEDADRERLSAAALRLAAAATVPETSRATALQVCGRLNLIEARSLALELARSERASMPLRIAAVATLGDLGGDAATRDYLEALTTGREKRLRVPAESALKRFSIN